MQPAERELVPAGEDGNDSDSDNLLALGPEALRALTSFLDERDAARNALLSFSIQSLPESSATIEDTLSSTSSSKNNRQLDKTLRTTSSNSKSPKITVEKFKEVFKENWQLSQFWYSQDTALRLGEALKSICTVKDHVAFLSCPTGYIAFKESGAMPKEIFLFEHDTRFATVAGKDFVPYDIDDPLSFPDAEALQGSMDIIVVDPPFHSESSQRKVFSTLAHIISPSGRLVLLTGQTLAPLIDTIYPSPPLPKLQYTDFSIEHDGMGRLETPYGCWVGGGSEGNQSVFGNNMGTSL